MELLTTNINKDNTESYTVVSPQTGEEIYKVIFNNEESIKQIINDAKSAQYSWSRLTLKSRVKFLNKYISLLDENREHIIELIQLENGKLKHEANAEVEKAIELAEFALGIPSLLFGKTEYVSRGIEVKEVVEPIGIVAMITPFNFPLMVPHWNLLNALVTGNSVILKPSSQTPKTMLFIKEILEKAGLPKGLLHIIYGESNQVNTIIENNDVNAVTFVGSTEIAKIIHRNSGLNNKRVLALGGAKNHTIITPGVDINNVAKEIIESAFGMSGQRCMATSVLSIVGDSNEIIDKLKELANERANYAAIINKGSINKIENFINKTDGKVILNGLYMNGEKIKTNYLRPTIIKYDNNTQYVDKEIFGPVLEVFEFSSIEEAIEFQNSSQYANGATIYTVDGNISEKIVKLSAGMLGVNIGVPVPREPFSFGGLKNSKFGYGDISGLNSLEFYINRKKITTKWNSNNRIDWTS